MLSFITFEDSIEQVEILFDEEGVDELISYLNYVKNSKDHLHLNIDTELDPAEITGERVGKSFYAKYVRIESLKNH